MVNAYEIEKDSCKIKKMRKMNEIAKFSELIKKKKYELMNFPNIKRDFDDSKLVPACKFKKGLKGKKCNKMRNNMLYKIKDKEVLCGSRLRQANLDYMINKSRIEKKCEKKIEPMYKILYEKYYGSKANDLLKE